MSLSEAAKVPNWEDDILPLIQKPYWITTNSEVVGREWVNEMLYWGKWDLSSYEDVRKRAPGIYNHLRSKSMPVTRNPDHYWPEEALELFRHWANNGYMRNKLDTQSTQIVEPVIPEPLEPPTSYRVRKDIMSMTREELVEYQSKLDDILHVQDVGFEGKQTKWQELGVLRTYPIELSSSHYLIRKIDAYWCLHYQEATFLWHRAYLRYVEELIDFPIPYWNGYAKEASVSSSKFAGIPPMFLEQDYQHPQLGKRKNPLRYAKALDGKSKNGISETVTRNETLTEGPSNPGWGAKIKLFERYHDQIAHALGQTTYTTSESAQHFGIPWANLVDFTDHQPDTAYPFRCDFDGLFEQVHDNFHGWVGYDMADNTYTAFDPIFLSYHANMDRLAGIFMDSNPENQFTSRFPLQPFMDQGKKVSYDDPRRWLYTTIGDMAKDSRALGYMYGEPASPDYYTPKTAEEKGLHRPRASGGQAIALPLGLPGQSSVNDGFTNRTLAKPPKRELVPYIIFTGVGCTISSYRIDVYTGNANSTTLDVVGNPDFIGQVTRLGMGRGREGHGPPNTGRCRKPVATRVLPAEKFNHLLDTDSGLKIVVTDLETGNVVDEEEYSLMSGFVPKLVWLPGKAQE
ncbi:beta-c chain unit d [Fusarium sporotrichioides]|uniref:tyrosinase n=1 Tax=Fusarium sporotrichioides TaxID=5514 RepID=A0A395S427_FUSSP|nr:beta-c chain unit d [Fusarium sporotrichioides]